MVLKVHQLREVVESTGKEETSLMLNDFKCSRNRDSEDFLRKSSLRHDERDISRTYLVMEGGKEIMGYFSLALKCLNLDETGLDPKIVRSMNLNKGVAQAYMLGQLAKSDDAPPGLGRTMLDHALITFFEGKRKFGCRMVRLDCKDELVNYYTKYGFIQIGRNTANDLNQMAVFI